MAKGGEAAQKTLAGYTAMVERISRLETAAVAELEAAFASMRD